MNSTFKKVALATALLASTSMVAPAFAATLATTGNTAGTENTIGTGAATNNAAYFAPAKTISGTAGEAVTLALGRGKNVALNITGLTNAGNIHLIAYYFDASDTFIEAVTVASDTTANGQTVLAPVATLPSNASYKYVRFGLRFVDVGDGVGTADAIVALKAVQSNGTANADANLRLVTRAIGKTNADAASAIATALKADTTISRYELSDYAGPTITSAKSSFSGTTGTTKPVFLTTDVGLQVIANGTDDKANISPLKASDSAVVGDAVKFNKTNSGTAADIDLGSRSAWLTADPATADKAWAAAVNSVKVLTSTGGLAKDLAGNLLAFPQNVTITAFDQPKFATTGTAKALVTAGPTLGDIYETTGATIANGSTVTVALRLNEALDDTASGLSSNDFTLANGNGFAITAAATGATADDEFVNLTLTNNSGANRFLKVDANGKLTIGTSSSDAAATTPTVTLAVEAASKLKTKTGATVIADVPAAEPLYVGITPTATIKTYDANADGTLDGVQIVADAPFSSTIAATSGISIQKASDTTVTAALSALSLDPTSAKKLRVPATQATIVGFLTGTQTQAANLNTGVTNTDLPFKVAIANSAQEYASVYKPATGTKVTLADVASSSTIADGASPVVLSATYLPEEGTSPAAGQLKIVASEALANVTALKAAQILLGGSSLQLLNLNDTVKALGDTDAARSKTTVDNDTVTIGVLGANQGKVTANVSGKALTFGSSASGLKDAADNNLATDGSKTVTTGATVYAGPKIAQAIATRSTNAVDGNIDQIVLKFDKGVTLAATGAVVDGMFKVRAKVDGTDYNVSIPKANIDLTAAATGYVTLSIPTPGIVGTTKLTELVVEYDANGVGGVGTGTVNRLISTDAVAAEIADTNSSLALDENDSDTRNVTFAKNTTKLYTMEVTGSLTTDGTAAAAKGTIVRADLVDFDTTLTFKSGAVTVPCSCTAGSTTIAVTSSNDIVDKLNEAVKLGKTSINAYANVNVNNQTASAMVVNLKSTVDGDKSYPITISTTGAVTGTAGATGTLVLEKAPALKVLDTVYQVTNTGAFRFAVGSDKAPTDAVVLVSSKQPADKFFTGLTSAVPSFANYLPFASNVVASGVIGGNLGTINLAKIASSSVSETTGWQLVGFQGAIARNSNAALKAKGVDATRLLVSVRPTTGEPVTAWSFDTAANADDEAFLLQNNVTASALQIGSASIDGLKDIDGGLALALKNPSGGFTRDSNANGEITSGDANTTIDTKTEPFSVFYPISGDSTAFNAGAGKWSLLTVEAAVSSANLATWTTNNKVAAIIVVGSGNAQKSWFKGSTTNTLTALSKGDRAFIYFEAANTAYKFGR